MTMGYFSNGTEGMIYQDAFCSRCINNRVDPDLGSEGCLVWDAHLLYAYEECESGSNAEQILDLLIPRQEPGLNGNGRCRMFVQDTAKEPLSAWVEENVL